MFGKHRHYFLVYRTSPGHPLDIRCPVGGVSVVCGPQVSATKLARAKVKRLFAQRPGERLPLVECLDAEEKYHARIMELSKRRADNKFRLEMLEMMK